MRSTLVALMVALAVAAFAGSAQAKSTSKSSSSSSKAKSTSYQGTIVSVTGKNITVDVGINRPERVVITIDDKTEVTGGGKKGTIADLAKGQIVSVEASNYHAKKIEVTGVRKSGD